MRRPGRRIGSFAMAGFLLVFGGLLGSCSGDGGGGGGGGDDAIRLYFGINNDGGCTSLTFDVDVVDAQAVIERNGNAVDCALNAALTANGCNVSFNLIDNGDTLRTTISGCQIPPVTNVFLCDFIDADISELTEQTTAVCSCRQNGCDTTPPVCISEVPDPGSCEDCDNLVDDDDNDLIDCADPNCEHSPLCGGDQETTTTSTTTTTSDGGVTSTTTTTLPVIIQNCTLTFRMTTAVTVGSMQWETDYSDAPGRMRGLGSAVRCNSLVAGALSSFSDNDNAEVLTAGLVSLAGATGPLDLAECKFDATGTPVLSDFDITVVQARDPDVNPIEPLPAVILKSLDCITATTTTSIIGGSTTTLDGGTTTTIDGGPTTTLDGGTTTTLPGNTGTFNVTFRLNSAAVPIGALQFSVNYAAAPGDFEGTAGDVTCSEGIVEALFAPNDKDAVRTLTLGIIALDAFSAPVNVATCKFIATTEADVPVASDFIVTIDDATDANGDDVVVGVGPVITPAP